MARKKKQDEESADDLNQADDTFGLPEIEYQPLQREETDEPASHYTSQSTEQTSNPMEREEPRHEHTSYYMEEDNEPSPWPRILGIAAFLLICGAAAWWYFGKYRPEQQEAQRLATEQQAEHERLRRESELAESRRLEAERRRADSLAAAAATPPTGTIDTITERTGRYYVIVASAIDGDLLIDYARKLTPKGVNPRLIPPHGNVKFYRLAVDAGDTYAATQARADELKAEYTEGTWVVKY